MIKPILTKEIAYKSLQDFFSTKPFVLFGTGTSCALDADFGMGALEAYLKDELNKADLSNEQKAEWDYVLQNLEDNRDFESSMNNIKDNALLKIVIDKTAAKVLTSDKKHLQKILNGLEKWTAIELFKRLVNTLPELDRALHVATPNYDMLAEYAFTNADIPYVTGFWGGVVRKLDWKQSIRQMTYAEKVTSGKSKPTTITRFKKHIRLYKIHGSLNTFIYNHNQLIETDICNLDPLEFERVIITPGDSKYERLHTYRAELLSEYDNAIKEHRSFLFLGFGFNDYHLSNKTLLDKLTSQECSTLIITRDSNDRIKKILDDSKNSWLVCKNESDNSTRVYNREYDGWLLLSDKELWKFDNFATEILGG